jgi:hypothetical protein
MSEKVRQGSGRNPFKKGILRNYVSLLSNAKLKIFML